MTAIEADRSLKWKIVHRGFWTNGASDLSSWLAELESANPAGAVQGSLAAWKTGSMTALEKDLLHSALVQYALRDLTGADLPLDGQVLRNPCRGPSCTALLHLWQTRAQEYGLPPVPGNAASEPNALRTVENVVVLRRLQGLYPLREPGS